MGPKMHFSEVPPATHKDSLYAGLLKRLKTAPEQAPVVVHSVTTRLLAEAINESKAKAIRGEPPVRVIGQTAPSPIKSLEGRGLWVDPDKRVTCSEGQPYYYDERDGELAPQRYEPPELLVSTAQYRKELGDSLRGVCDEVASEMTRRNAARAADFRARLDADCARLADGVAMISADQGVGKRHSLLRAACMPLEARLL